MAGAGLDLAWDADPSRESLDAVTGELLARFGTRLRSADPSLVRLSEDALAGGGA